MASSAPAYPNDPLAAAATEPSAGASENPQAMDQTRVDAAALVVEVPVRAYHAYEPGVIVAQKFQLVRMLGEGGMGSVWVAKNLALDVHVALKLIRSELANSVNGLEERLLQEARAAASIDHPAVIQIFDFGLTELRDPFIAMELLHGESLGGTISRRGRVSPVRAVQTLLPIADALLSAHERGVVHRDLKPDNIFLSRGAGGGLVPKILDFGIAKLDRNLTPNLTGAGIILGSPAYMSPEQARGETDVDGRTDVWALCVVLYEAITGRLPFQGDNYNALLYAILDGQPKSFGDLGFNEPLLWSIILHGLEKDRERRYPDMFELGRALAAWLLGRGINEDVCSASLKSKWLERSKRQATTQVSSFFPSDPPASEQEARTLRSSSAEQGPLDSNGTPSSGVLLRPAGQATASHVLATQLATTTKRMAPSFEVRARSALKRFTSEARSRWVLLTIAGAGLSFSVAVGLQALSGSRDDDDTRAATMIETPRRSQIPLATVATVATVVEMPRPLPTATPAVAHHATSVTPKSQHAAEPKPAHSDSKNPLR